MAELIAPHRGSLYGPSPSLSSELLMLQNLRALTRGWVAYVLLFLLAVAFAIWGVNGVFSGGGGRDLATLGGRAVSPVQLTRELDLAVRNQRNQGNDVTRQDAIDAGFHVQLLDAIIGRVAMHNLADKLAVSVSDAQVAERIREIPMVLNPITGSFDETAYGAFLQQLGYSRADFESEFRYDLTTQMLMQSLLSGVRAPSSYGALVLAYAGETRVVSIAEGASIGAVPAPTEPQVQAFYEEFQERLRVPEYRSLTLVVARLSDFAARVDIPESRLREEYEARRAALIEPERRSFVRITATNEAQASQIASRLSRGENPDTVAASAGLQAVRGENQARQEVLDARVAEAVFSTPANAPALVVRGELSPFVVVRVSSITPGSTRSFESVRTELREFLAADEAGALLDAAVGAFEDARGGGASIADAARQAGLPIVTIAAIDAEGRDRQGQAVAALADQEQVIATAFSTTEGEASDFVPMGDADVVVSVDSVTPATVRPLSEVREMVVAGWTVRERARLLRELGEGVVEAVRGGRSFAEAARASGLRVVINSQPLNRQMAANLPANGLPGQIFAANEGDVLSDVRVDGNAVVVAIVESINRVDPNADPQALETARAQVQEGLADSVAEALQQDIVDRANVRRNEDLLRQLYRTSDAQDDQAQ
jgi:peptidyl-prolyl cis-trans isomerase D